MEVFKNYEFRKIGGFESAYDVVYIVCIQLNRTLM